MKPILMALQFWYALTLMSIKHAAQRRKILRGRIATKFKSLLMGQYRSLNVATGVVNASGNSSPVSMKMEKRVVSILSGTMRIAA